LLRTRCAGGGELRYELAHHFRQRALRARELFQDREVIVFGIVLYDASSVA
jgi:hypothetical protein